MLHITCVKMTATLFHVVVLTLCFQEGSFIKGHGRKASTCLIDSQVEVNLTCELSQRIHVISKIYQTSTSTCEDAPASCSYRDDAPATACNGVWQCQEQVSSFGINRTCGTGTGLATVLYECIEETNTNICTVTTVSHDNTLYFASPTYPRDSGNMKTNGTCVCDITGMMMKVDILEMAFRNTGHGIRGRLVVIGDMAAWTTDNLIPIAYNREIIRDTENIKIAFNDYGQISQDMWLRVSGSSNMTATCYHGDDNITVPLFTTPSPPRTEAGSPKSIVVITASAAVGASLVVLVIIAVAVIVYRKQTIASGKEYTIEVKESNEEMKEVEDCDMPTFTMDTLM